ncbi:GLG2 Glycogenin-2 [Candida maltosa Xu316]
MTNAIFTLLYNTNYLAGALVLGTTLKKLLSPSDREHTKLGILIDKSNFTPYQLQLLSNYYDELIDVSPLKSTIVDKLTYDLKRPELDKTFTKINLWSLIKYEKILYLDSDTLPIIPINEDAGSILNLLALDFPKFKILAAPDSGFPDIFNSGVFVLRPNLDDFTKLSALVKESATNPDVSFDGADQGLLNQYFNAQPDWVQNLLKKSGSTGTTDLSDVNYTQESNWIKIPFLYNVTPSAEYQYLPAFKHFQQPPGVLEQPPAEVELEDHGGEQPKHDEEVWKTTVDTLGRYHSTALLTTQVKLVHFIGPYKPWRSSSNIGGIHKDWWKIWIDEFGEKSVPDVIYREQHPIQETSLEQHDEPHQYEEIISETHEEEEVIEEIPQPPPIDTSDPNSLLDPANYQRFEDNVQPSIDSMWDPTREPPPVHEEYSAPQGYEDFDQSLKSFTNEWDQPDHHHQPQAPPPPPPAPEPYYAPPDYHEEQHPPQYHHEEHHEEQHHEEHHHEEQHHEEQHHEDHHEEAHFEETLAPSVFFTPSDLYAPMEPKEKPELYGHRYVEPERVFDTDNDYYPNHILQEVEKIDISKESNDESKDLSPNPANLATNVTGFNEANEDFSKGGYIEENPFEEIYDEDQEGIDPEIIEEELLELEEEEEMEIPKLFPWEFREKGKVVTERVFDF